jgi:ribosomal protein S18 acetylase RimI-like enzyme
MNVQIRRATLDDAQTIAAHNAAMAQETENVLLDAERVRLGVDAVLRDPAKGFYTVAALNGVVIGQLMITFEWSDWRNGTFWWIQSVYVQPEYRRLGVYRRLYQHVLGEAEARPDVCGIRLYVSKENSAARQVYERLAMHAAHYDMYEVDFVLERGR